MGGAARQLRRAGLVEVAEPHLSLRREQAKKERPRQGPPAPHEAHSVSSRAQTDGTVLSAGVNGEASRVRA